MPDKIITKLISTIDNSITGFNESIPAIQQQIFDDIALLVKDLETTSDGTIKNSVKNLKLIGRIRGKLEEIILSPEYMKKVEDFVKAFNEVADLQNQYFKAIEDKFKPSALLSEISKQSIGWTIDGLTEAGIGANVTDEIESVLRNNITLGGSYKDLTGQLRNLIISNKAGDGLLEKYTRQVTHDAIQQYNAQYSSAISDDLNLNWFMYTGTLIETSREFCIKLIEKKYIHRSEIPIIVTGKIDGEQVALNPKTKLWPGAYPNTTASNFQLYRGGYFCGHLLQPVLSGVVPKNIRDKFPL